MWIWRFPGSCFSSGAPLSWLPDSTWGRSSGSLSVDPSVWGSTLPMEFAIGIPNNNNRLLAAWWVIIYSRRHETSRFTRYDSFFELQYAYIFLKTFHSWKSETKGGTNEAFKARSEHNAPRGPRLSPILLVSNRTRLRYVTKFRSTAWCVHSTPRRHRLQRDSLSLVIRNRSRGTSWPNDSPQRINIRRLSLFLRPNNKQSPTVSRENIPE